MDQLHEELKEVTPPPPELLLMNDGNKSIGCSGSGTNLKNLTLTSTNRSLDESPPVTDEERSQCSTPSLSQSEAEYETCDSGVSEQSSLSDEATCSARSLPKFIHLPASATASVTNTSLSMSLPINCGIQTQSVSSTYSRSPSPTSSQRTNKSAYKSNRSNSVSSISSLSTAQQQQQQQQKHPSSKQSGGSSSTKPPHRSIISDVFDGKLLSSVQCLTCDRVSTREETFQDLSLPIPGKDHLNVLHQSQGIMAPISSSPGGGGLNSINCTDAVSCNRKPRFPFSFPQMCPIHSFIRFVRCRCIKSIRTVGFGGSGIG